MRITVVQSPYFMPEPADEHIATFLLKELEKTERNSLIVLPEYSNAGGISDKVAMENAMPRAEMMLKRASGIAKEKQAYVAINVFVRRDGEMKNSTYLFDKQGETAFIYDKIHLPPSEIALGITPGTGACTCEVDGIRFGFLTCYDVYFNEQIEFLAAQKPDILIVPSYQRSERADIIHAQTKLIAFRCNAFVARASYCMNSDSQGGCAMIVGPDGQIYAQFSAEIGSLTAEIDPHFKYMRTAGFGGGEIRNDAFIDAGLRPDAF